MGKKIRLDKFLADMGKGSRSQIREAARKGRIQVNGQMEKSQSGVWCLKMCQQGFVPEKPPV